MRYRNLVFLFALVVCSLQANSQTSTSFGGTVVDDDGNVVVGATITATNLATNQSWTSTTDSNGSYRFTNLPPGRYSVVVESSGFKSSERQEIEPSFGQSTTLNLRVSSRTPERYAIRGLVTDRKNNPQSNALVTVKDHMGEQVTEVRTDSQGQYSIDGVKSSRVSITIAKSGFKSFVKNLSLRSGIVILVRHRLRKQR